MLAEVRGDEPPIRVPLAMCQRRRATLARNQGFVAHAPPAAGSRHAGRVVAFLGHVLGYVRHAMAHALHGSHFRAGLQVRGVPRTDDAVPRLGHPDAINVFGHEYHQVNVRSPSELEFALPDAAPLAVLALECVMEGIRVALDDSPVRREGVGVREGDELRQVAKAGEIYLVHEGQQTLARVPRESDHRAPLGRLPVLAGGVLLAPVEAMWCHAGHELGAVLAQDVTVPGMARLDAEAGIRRAFVPLHPSHGLEGWPE